MLKYNGRVLKYNNRFLTSLDHDAKLFFERAGLNSESNLDVDGLYTAEQARYWVNWLVKGIKDIGAWDKFKDYAIYLHLGGTEEMTAVNLCNDDFTIDWIDDFIFDGLGSKPATSNSRGNTNISPIGFEEFHTIGFSTNDNSTNGVDGNNLDISTTGSTGTYNIDISSSRTGGFNNTLVAVSGDYAASYNATVLSSPNLGTPTGVSTSRRDGWSNLSTWKDTSNVGVTNLNSTVYSQSVESKFYLCGNEGGSYSLRRHCVDYFTPTALTDNELIQLNNMITIFNRSLNRI